MPAPAPAAGSSRNGPGDWRTRGEAGRRRPGRARGGAAQAAATQRRSGQNSLPSGSVSTCDLTSPWPMPAGLAPRAGSREAAQSIEIEVIRLAMSRP